MHRSGLSGSWFGSPFVWVLVQMKTSYTVITDLYSVERSKRLLRNTMFYLVVDERISIWNLIFVRLQYARQLQLARPKAP